MKKLFIIGLISIFFIGCSPDEVKITNKNLNCQNHRWNSGYCEVIGDLGGGGLSTIKNEDYVVNCILYYKKNPFTGTIKWRKINKNTYHTLFNYECQYIDGKRDGLETKETWYNNYPKTVETVRWWDNVKGKYTKVPFYF